MLSIIVEATFAIIVATAGLALLALILQALGVDLSPVSRFLNRKIEDKYDDKK